MVERIQIVENRNKLANIFHKLEAMIRLHDSALITYKVRGELHTLPQEHIDGFIEDYKELKAEGIKDFKDLL